LKEWRNRYAREALKTLTRVMADAAKLLGMSYRTSSTGGKIGLKEVDVWNTTDIPLSNYSLKLMAASFFLS